MTPSPPHPWVSLKTFPIVVITFSEESTAAEVRAMTHAMRQFAAELTEPIAVVTDLADVRTSDPETRSIYAQFVRDMKRVAGHWVRGTAVITSSTFQRTVFNVHATLVGNTPYPVRAFSSQSQALPWLEARLSASATSGANPT